MILFNEIEPFAASWMANQYTEATIDARSIRDLAPADLAGFRRVHFFAGIGGWELALRLAGWPEDEEVWTGSCPCQPFSVAGKRGGTDDERHLWPEFFRLVKACRPRWAMGEQVSSKDGLVWLDGVFNDLEAEGYTCWAVDTCAAGVGAPHIRQRLYWCATNRDCWRCDVPGRCSGLRMAESVEVEDAQKGLCVQEFTKREHLYAPPNHGNGEGRRSDNGSHQPQQARQQAIQSQSGYVVGKQPQQGDGRWCLRPEGPEKMGCLPLGRKEVPLAGVVCIESRSDGGQSGGVAGLWDHSGCPTHRLEHAPSDGRDARRAESAGESVASGCGVSGMGDAASHGKQRLRSINRGGDGAEAVKERSQNAWSNAAIIHCRDGKSRPISPESGDEPLAYGIPLKTGHIVAALGELGIDPKTAKRIIANARRNRTGRLRGYGNAIVPQCAVEFIKSVMEA